MDGISRKDLDIAVSVLREKGMNDIAKIIGLKLLTNQYDEVEMSKEQYVQVRKLHEEVKFALEILVVSGKAELGKYTRKDNYGDDWKKVV